MCFSALLYLVGMLSFLPHDTSLQYQHDNTVVIELRLKADQLKDSGLILFTPVNYSPLVKPSQELTRAKNGNLLISKNINEPFYINLSFILKERTWGYFLVEPGDQVVISSNSSGLFFSGKGSEKYRLRYQLDSIGNNIPKPNNKTGLASFKFDSIGEYHQWKNYLQQQFDISVAVIEKYKNQLSTYAYALIKDYYIRSTISALTQRFGSLQDMIEQKKLNIQTVLDVYDSSFSPIIDNWITYAVDKPTLKNLMMAFRINRVFSFDKTKTSSKEIRLLLFKERLKAVSGIEKERLMVTSFPKSVMINVGFTEEVEKMLREYYADSSFPEYKAELKKEELLIRKNRLRGIKPNFTLVDRDGELFTRDKLNGKFVVLHFWKSDVDESRQMMAKLTKLESIFAGNDKVLFAHISVDSSRKQWLKNIFPSKNLTTIHAYTGGIGINNYIIRDYAVTNYPTIWLINPEGDVMNVSPEVDLTKDGGIVLKEMLWKHTIALANDGPYIWHTDHSLTSYYIKDTIVEKKALVNNETFTAQTDLNRSFSIKLQKKLLIQPSEYTRQEKMLVFSDIEGNFDALRKLLQKNGVIDQEFNWIFGKGHLVFAGDMFDRGYQVTECLWLLYSLEEKAKAAGGYMHFVLGNHEIMNMQGNHRYARDKYIKNAKLMGKTLTELYNENTELGRWLRTKNVIEKIGDLLFVHGGISPEVNRLSLSIEDINKTVRPYYGGGIDSSNKVLLTLYDSRIGESYRISPFWSRGYYKGRKRITNAQLDSTLKKFNVQRIITGHTILKNTITVHYNGRVINTDTKHAQGQSEALLIEGNRFYRVNDKGERKLLFIDDK